MFESVLVSSTEGHGKCWLHSFWVALGVSLLLANCRTAQPPQSTALAEAPDEVGAQEGPDRPTLQYRSYQVRFTNPLCDQYDYETPVETADGSAELSGKPKNVFCTRSDKGPSGDRAESPQKIMIDWIDSLGEGDEAFLAYLSFSNRPIAQALCAAARRSAKITVVLDKDTDRSDEVKECGGEILIRGHKPDIGYAHNKLMLVNPDGAGPGDNNNDFMRLVFSSGNLSSGAVIHHENWHFIEVKRGSYFAEAHRCMMQSQLSESDSESRGAYTAAINECRGNIAAPEESDISAYFIPNDDDSRSIIDRLVRGVAEARTVDMAAHRFTLSPLARALRNRLRNDDSFQVRLVADDDLYWLDPFNDAPSEELGPNRDFERDILDPLVATGDGRFQVKYMETNHSAFMLHHNKFIIYNDMPNGPDAVLCGAANLTGTGFGSSQYPSNFENIYWVEIPEVVEAFKKQYQRFWDGRRFSEDTQTPPQATAPGKMPARNVIPN